MSSHGDALIVEQPTSDEIPTVPTVGSGMVLNREELMTMYKYLQHQHIPYENQPMIQLVKKIREAIQ